MLTSDFDYDLPKELIAQKPLPERHQSRMMVLNRKTGDIIHSCFEELLKHLGRGEVLVLNNTRVIPARVWGKKEGKEIECLFLKESEKGIWEVLCRPAKKVKLGAAISFSEKLEGQIIKVENEGRRMIRFSSPDVLSELKKIGFAPLPPYIKRKAKDIELRALDLERYQTAFAQKEGAIAAPTAGLHFTNQILDKLQSKGIIIAKITLDVGLATFQPVRVKQIKDHKMFEESYSISPSAAAAITAAKKNSRSVTAVGSTSVRALESAWEGGQICPGKKVTSLFIYPGYKFKVINKLLTNFHLPKSSLLMMISAFAGLDFIRKAYKEAVHKKYRFYSYGDCMLII